MFDVFIGEVRCPGCAATVTAELQTYLLQEAASFRIGHVFAAGEVSPTNIANSGYVTIGEPGVLRLLDKWGCVQCQTEQWAIVTIEDAVFTHIEAVPFTREAFERASHIREYEAELLAE